MTAGKIITGTVIALSLGMIVSSCKDQQTAYPAGCVVAVKVGGVDPANPAAKEFNSWVLQRLAAFSEEKKNFSVDSGTVTKSAKPSGNVTHLLEISVDSLNLVSDRKYKDGLTTVAKIDTALDRIPSEIRNSLEGGIFQSVFLNAAYRNIARPVMYATLSLKETSTARVIWTSSEKIEMASVQAMNDNEQLSELMGALKSRVQEKVVFFK